MNLSQWLLRLGEALIVIGFLVARKFNSGGLVIFLIGCFLVLSAFVLLAYKKRQIGRIDSNSR